MAFLVATTSLPAVYRLNGYARTTTAGTPHARANYPFFYLDDIPLDSFGPNFETTSSLNSSTPSMWSFIFACRNGLRKVSTNFWCCVIEMANDFVPVSKEYNL